MRVLVTGARAPVALHWARLLHAAGHEAILADSQRLPIARATRFKAGYVRLPSPRGAVASYAEAVAGLVRKEGCDLAVPTCEEVFYLAAARDLYGAEIPLFAPPFSLLAQVHNKNEFAKLAAEFGMAPPETILINDAAALAELLGRSRDLVFKPVWSRFGERVLIGPSPEEARKLRPCPTDPWVAQTLLPGEELCSWSLAREGRLLALQAYRPVYRAGKGAGLAFEPVAHGAISAFVRRFVEKTGWTGQISFDFRHDAAGALRAIECNPRATSGLHFFQAGDGLAEALVDGTEARASGRDPMTLPLAMLAYGLPCALRQRRFGQWLRDFRSMRDLGRWPQDRGLTGAQFLALGEIAVTAIIRRKGLKAAATDDIEWNGESLAPP